VTGQQYAVLERARFAFVRVAYDVMFRAFGVAAELPFHGGDKAGAATPAQIRAVHLAEQRGNAACQRGRNRGTRYQRRAKQDIGTTNVIVYPGPVRWPLSCRHARFNQLCKLRDTPGVEPRDHLMMIDQQGRPLIAETRAGTEIDADPAILAHLPALDAKAPAEIIQQGRVTLHAVGDVVAEQHAVLAGRARMEKAIERCDAFHMCECQAKRAGDIAKQIA